MPSGIDTRFFGHPGFDVLYGTWSEVLEQDEVGSFIVDPNDAITMLRQARAAAITEGVSPENAKILEGIAFRTATQVKASLDEVDCV